MYSLCRPAYSPRSWWAGTRHTFSDYQTLTIWQVNVHSVLGFGAFSNIEENCFKGIVNESRVHGLCSAYLITFNTAYWFGVVYIVISYQENNTNSRASLRLLVGIYHLIVTSCVILLLLPVCPRFGYIIFLPSVESWFYIYFSCKWAWFRLGSIKSGQGNYTEAINCFQQAIRADEDDR